MRYEYVKALCMAQLCVNEMTVPVAQLTGPVRHRHEAR